FDTARAPKVERNARRLLADGKYVWIGEQRDAGAFQVVAAREQLDDELRPDAARVAEQDADDRLLSRSGGSRRDCHGCYSSALMCGIAEDVVSSMICTRPVIRSACA